MLDVKRATNVATTYLMDLLGEDAISNVRLEEVEFIRQGDFVEEDTPDEVKPHDADEWDRTYWLITVSYLPKNPNPIVTETRQRQYKIFKLEAETGDLVAMKMREVA